MNNKNTLITPTDPPATSAPFAALLGVLSNTHHQLQQHAARIVDLALVLRNWLFGWYRYRYRVEFEQGAGERAQVYGKNLIQKLSDELSLQGIKGVSPTNLRQCRSFYLSRPEIQQPVAGESLCEQDIVVLQQKFSLGWSHYVQLMTLSNEAERQFYEIEARANSWSRRELKRQIDSALYERLALSRDKDAVVALSMQGQVVAQASDVLKSPYVLEFLNLPDLPIYSEHDLEMAIVNNLEQFLLELGKGFLFEARQKRFTFDDDHFYVDLVFYNRLLRCYVLVDLKLDLKRDKLTHQDLGQMQMYVNYFDRHVKTADEMPTIGMVLCHQKNDALVELTLPADANIYASNYQLYLPSKEALKQQMQQAEQEFSMRMQLQNNNTTKTTR